MRFKLSELSNKTIVILIFAVCTLTRAAFHALDSLSHPRKQKLQPNCQYSDLYGLPSEQTAMQRYARACIPCQCLKFHLTSNGQQVLLPNLRHRQALNTYTQTSSRCPSQREIVIASPAQIVLRAGLFQICNSHSSFLYEGWIMDMSIWHTLTNHNRSRKIVRVTTVQGTQPIDRIKSFPHYSLSSTLQWPDQSAHIRYLKATIRGHQDKQWTRRLPIIFLAIRAA